MGAKRNRSKARVKSQKKEEETQIPAAENEPVLETSVILSEDSSNEKFVDEDDMASGHDDDDGSEDFETHDNIGSEEDVVQDDDSVEEDDTNREESDGDVSIDDSTDNSEVPSEDDEASDEENNYEPVTITPMISAMGEQCSFDLHNLLAVNSHQLQVSRLYSSNVVEEENIAIPGDSMPLCVSEEFLCEKATDGCTQLIHALWQLPVEKSDGGPLIVLPNFPETKLPRQLPPPQSKAETKWEKFAKLRGIPVNKSKRSQKVWDEAEQEWKFRHGYNKANSSGNDWPIMEVGANDDPFEDPWERMREGKRGRVEKNLVSRMKNEEKAGTLPKGTAKKTVKAIEKARTVGKGKGNKDTGSQIPVGVPVDLKARKGSEGLTSLQRGRENTHKALLATQRSTASMGKFDGLRDGEPEKKKTVLHGKKRKFESSTDKKVIASESDRGLKVLDSVMNGGGKERDRAKRKGSLAKGETAFDYDFDDGLGPSTFKKKKGRAGAGKMKKMTKKRTK